MIGIRKLIYFGGMVTSTLLALVGLVLLIPGAILIIAAVSLATVTEEI
jgi:hypothetical protein